MYRWKSIASGVMTPRSSGVSWLLLTLSLKAECLGEVVCGLIQRQTVVGGPEVQEVPPTAVGLEALKQVLLQVDREAVARWVLAQRAGTAAAGLPLELVEYTDSEEDLFEGHLLAKEPIVD